MFFTLLLVTFLIAAAVSFGVVYFFDDSIGKILTRVASQELAHAWRRYVTFAAYVVGISGGVRVHHLEQYVNARSTDNVVLDLTPEAWTLEVYRTVIGTLQSLEPCLDAVSRFCRRPPGFCHCSGIRAQKPAVR